MDETHESIIPQPNPARKHGLYETVPRPEPLEGECGGEVGRV
jgi:hypothetical protein